MPPRILACLAFACVLPACTLADTPLFTAQGYRQTLYRSPTPPGVDHAQTVDTAQLQALLQQSRPPLLIDVYKRPWLNDRFVATEPHANLPGSHWLANTGDGALDSAWANYLRRHLQRLTAGDLDHPVVFYCRADCWLSWNAVKRASALGYRRLYWYRDGLDAWEGAGLPVSAATPETFP